MEVVPDSQGSAHHVVQRTEILSFGDSGLIAVRLRFVAAHDAIHELGRYVDTDLVGGSGFGLRAEQETSCQEQHSKLLEHRNPPCR